MSRSLWCRIALTLCLIATSASSALAWWDRCSCQPPVFHPVPPASIYAHGAGPAWRANGWSYPPVGGVGPAILAPVPPAFVAAPSGATAIAPRYAEPGPPFVRARGGVQPLK
jgi:hypothetical protein